VYTESKHFLVTQGYKEGPLVHIVSAMASAMTTDCITNPMLVIKTRLQTQIIRKQEERYNSAWDAFVRMTREEGVGSLYKGLLPQILGITHVMIQFPLYEKFKEELKNDRRENLGPLGLICASSLSKMIASVCTYPHEVLRARLQTQHETDISSYKGVRDAIIRIWQEEGARAFYSGMQTNLLRVIPSCAITFTAYEMIQEYLSKDHNIQKPTIKQGVQTVAEATTSRQS